MAFGSGHRRFGYGRDRSVTWLSSRTPFGCGWSGVGEVLPAAYLGALTCASIAAKLLSHSSAPP